MAQDIKRKTEEIAVVPKVRKHNGTVVIGIVSGRQTVAATYEKSEKFRQIVKSLNYEWDYDLHSWILELTEMTGTADDRIAELGSRLLNAGFAVAIKDEEVRRKAIEADYEPAHRRWIYTSKSSDHLCLKWPYDDGLYGSLRHIRGSEWCRDAQCMRAPLSSLDQIRDAANVYDFKFTASALKRIAEWEQTHVDIFAVPAPSKEVEKVNKLEEILNSDRGVIDDLKDED